MLVAFLIMVEWLVAFLMVFGSKVPIFSFKVEMKYKIMNVLHWYRIIG